ncbi:MAG: hypothetical protein QGH37_15455 [Candidatus Poribacteria bacterium]|nr:hypothetical protein [Candidatus Poribacteria bacterium]MDP6996854.1 hypothetical protein [Candidatus Poribacteria bacterium]
MPIKATAAEAEKAAKMGFRVYKQSTEREHRSRNQTSNYEGVWA